jgi:uncharacterized protein HemX
MSKILGGEMASIPVEDLDEQQITVEPVQSVAQAEVTPDTSDLAVPSVITQKRGVSKLIVPIALIILIALGVGLVLILKDRNHLKNEVSKLSQSQQATLNEATELNNEVGKLIQLPTDEVPTVATVIDAAKVKSQAFFANAQNGDKLLLYSKSGKAILYRPSTKKIIEVAPINLGNSQPQPGTTTKNQ